MRQSDSHYVVVTPARNEQDYIGFTIQSMRRQTVRPRCWVIVDDGSTDRTGEVAEAAARENPWLVVLHRKDRGFRKQGGGVIEAFYDGYGLLDEQISGRNKGRGVPDAAAWDFLVKLDADLSFEPDYFEKCLQQFVKDASLGIGGGMVSHVVNQKLLPESPDDPAFHVRGATKIYRRACWEQIGGLIRAPGWDTVDELKANMVGWTTRTFREIALVHHRHTGDADGSWKNWVKNGEANYVTGYHPIFMFFKCIKRCREKPYLIAACALAWGYLRNVMVGAPQVPDSSLVAYVRRQQLNKLLFRPSLW